MIYIDEEVLHHRLFEKMYITRWFQYKKVYFDFSYKAYLDLWEADKNKMVMLYKTTVFFSVFDIKPLFVYRSNQAANYRQKSKHDSFVIYDNLRFLLNLRHFMFFGYQT